MIRPPSRRERRRRPAMAPAPEGGWTCSWRTTRAPAPTTGTRRGAWSGGTDELDLAFACREEWSTNQSTLFRVQSFGVYHYTRLPYLCRNPFHTLVRTPSVPQRQLI